MGTYVVLLKEREDENVVVYRYGRHEDHMGKIQLDKRTERFSELEPVPAAPRASRRLFDAAATRIALLWREGGGFPERAVYET